MDACMHVCMFVCMSALFIMCIVSSASLGVESRVYEVISQTPNALKHALYPKLGFIVRLRLNSAGTSLLEQPF